MRTLKRIACAVMHAVNIVGCCTLLAVLAVLSGLPDVVVSPITSIGGLVFGFWYASAAIWAEDGSGWPS